MKNLCIFFIFYFTTFSFYSLKSQVVFEQVMNKEENYKPIFSNENSKIDFTLYKSFEIGEKDTSYQFKITLANTKLEAEGVSVNFGLAFSSNGTATGLSDGKQFKITKLNNECTFNLDTLELFLKYANDIYVFAQNKPRFSTFAYKKLKNLKLAVELPETNFNNKSYYFSIGEAVFSITEDKFKDIIMAITKARDIWQRAKQE